MFEIEYVSHKSDLTKLQATQALSSSLDQRYDSPNTKDGADGVAAFVVVANVAVARAISQAPVTPCYLQFKWIIDY